MKVCVLKGGISGEREVSLRSGAAVANAMRQLGWQVDEFDVASRGFATPAADVLFIALHGTYGEDGELQARLETENRVFTGPGSKACALAMNKLETKKAFAAAGVPTPKGGLWQPGMPFALPYVLKPVSEGSSLGLSLVFDASQAAEAERVSLAFGRPMMIEEMIRGRELTVGILGDQALPIIEVIPKDGHFDYHHKYTAGMATHLCPAPLSDAQTRRVQEIALGAHRAAGCRVMSRVDVLMRGEDEFYALEVNTIPGMTELSFFPEAAAKAGSPFPETCRRIVELSIEARKAERKS